MSMLPLGTLTLSEIGQGVSASSSKTAAEQCTLSPWRRRRGWPWAQTSICCVSGPTFVCSYNVDTEDVFLRISLPLADELTAKVLTQIWNINNAYTRPAAEDLDATPYPCPIWRLSSDRQSPKSNALYGATNGLDGEVGNFKLLKHAVDKCSTAGELQIIGPFTNAVTRTRCPVLQPRLGEILGRIVNKHWA